MRNDLHLGSTGNAMLAGAASQVTNQRNLAHALTVTTHRRFALGAVLGVLITAAALQYRPEGTVRRRGDVR